MSLSQQVKFTEKSGQRYNTSDDATPPSQELRVFKPNSMYLFGYIFAIMCVGTQMGMTLSNVNQVGECFTLKFKWDTFQADLHHTILQSATTAGTAIGAFYGGRLIKIGRRKAAIYINIVAIVCVLPTLILEFWVITVFKFFWGCACGAMGVITARMIEETFPIHMSAVGGCMTNTSYGLGAMISIVLGMVLPNKKAELETTENWRIIFGFPMVLSSMVILFFTLVFTHDSPKYYLSVNDEENARKAIRRLYDMDHNDEDEILEFMRASCVKDTSSTTLKQALTDRRYRAATWTCLILIFYHEIVGINVVLAYSSKILQNINKKAHDLHPDQPPFITAKLGTTIIGIVNFLATVGSIPFISRFGRVKLMLWGHFAIFVFHMLNGIFAIEDMNLWQLGMMNLFLVAYEISSGTICWIYIAEVVVDSALGLCVLTLFSTVFVLNLFVEFLFDAKGFGSPGVFMSMGVMSLTAVFFIYFYMKETMGLTDKQKKRLYLPKDLQETSEWTALKKTDQE